LSMHKFFVVAGSIAARIIAACMLSLHARHEYYCCCIKPACAIAELPSDPLSCPIHPNY